MAMRVNDPSTAKFTPNGEDGNHQALLEGAEAIGASGTPRTEASGTVINHPNEIVLKALSDGATVRIRVSGEISRDRSAGNVDTIRDDDVAISRIDERGELDSLRFSGEIIEFEILDGDIEVSLNDEDVDPVTLDLPNEIVLKSLTDEAEVRIKVSGMISADHLTGDVETICDGHVLTNRIDAEDEPSTFRFSGDVVEFKVMRGDVKVTFAIAERDSC